MSTYTVATQQKAATSTFMPVRGEILQRQCACGQHTGGGECTECRQKREGTLQRTAVTTTFTPIHSGTLQRCSGGVECAECRQKREAMMQRAAESGAPVSSVPPIVHDVLNSPGQPLDAETRTFMEPRFSYDFSGVRVHTDARAAESARSVNALAYTVGRDVVFGAGQYMPETMTGKRLVAHELTHVVQQGGNVEVPQTKLSISTPGDAGEREAEYIEKTMVSTDGTSNLSSHVTHALPHRIQRLVRPENISCHDTGLTHPDTTGEDAVTAIQNAEAEASILALRAQLLLDVNLLFAQDGELLDPAFDTILQEELGLTLTNPAHFPLIRQQVERFRRVHETLESGILRYICRGGTVPLVGCDPPGQCGPNFAFSCPANRLIVLCQAFWDNPDQQSATILHEPFHILFEMARHATNALKRADASCFESFALRATDQGAFASCVDHTAG